jgi:uncharacterized membrane protein YraQ (UPF0718 family)
VARPAAPPVPRSHGLVCEDRPGAAIAFLKAGAVTSIPAAVAVFALVKRPVFVWYLAVVLAGSLASGTAYQAFLTL